MKFFGWGREKSYNAEDAENAEGMHGSPSASLRASFRFAQDDSCRSWQLTLATGKLPYFLMTGVGDASCGNILNATSCAWDVDFLFTSVTFSVSVPLRTK